MQVLVADDDLTLATFLSGIVRRKRHEALVARSGAEAWDIFNAHRPRVVVTDWMMPGMSGVELCRRIRATPDDGIAPYILMVTALSAKENLVEGFAAGANDYLAKPPDAAEVACRIEEATRAADEKLTLAARAHRDTIESCQRIVGGEHEALAPSFEALSKLYAERKAYAQARAFLRRQIALVMRKGELDEVKRLEEILAGLTSQEDALLEGARSSQPRERGPF